MNEVRLDLRLHGITGNQYRPESTDQQQEYPEDRIADIGCYGYSQCKLHYQ